MIKFSKYFIPYTIILFLIGFRGKIIIVFLFVILHEMVHYLTARRLGFSGFDILILPFGASLRLKNLEDASIEEDILISISGPLMNFILAAIFYVLFKANYSKELYLFFMTNLSLGIFNLLPAFPLDGGRILRDILSRSFIYKKAAEITVRVSIVSAFLLLISYGLLFLYGKNNLNLLVISFFIFWCSLKEKERIVYIIMNDIIKKKVKFLQKGYIENRAISIFQDKDLLFALAMFDKNKYTVVTVLNKEMKVIDFIFEEEIVTAIKEYGNITFKEFIEKREKID